MFSVWLGEKKINEIQSKREAVERERKEKGKSKRTLTPFPFALLQPF